MKSGEIRNRKRGELGIEKMAKNMLKQGFKVIDIQKNYRVIKKRDTFP